LKFTSSAVLKEKILSTGDRELVYASRYDRVFGVGFTEEQCKRELMVTNKRENCGESLLAKALMSTRTMIREEEAMVDREEVAQDDDNLQRLNGNCAKTTGVVSSKIIGPMIDESIEQPN
jgi:hypothetical protein